MHNVKLSERANADLRDIQIRLTEYSEETARKHVVRLANSIELIGREPFLWAYFFLTSAPYRAKLFFIGRSSFWIVYQLDEVEQAVNILRRVLTKDRLKDGCFCDEMIGVVMEVMVNLQ